MNESPPGTPDFKELESKKVSFERYNEILSENVDPGGCCRLACEDSRYVFLSDVPSESRGDEKQISIFHINCQGLNSSFDFINDISSLSVFQVIGLTETWLNKHNSELLRIPGYSLFTKNRELRQHGGLAAYVRSDIKVTVKSDMSVYKEMVFESFVLQLKIDKFQCFVIVAYRPPSSAFDEFVDLLEQQLEKIPVETPCFLMGDLNVDLIDPGQKTNLLLDMMISYGLIPSINVSTRVTASTAKCLDNIFTNVPFSNPCVLVSDTSDHFGVFGSYSTSTQTSPSVNGRFNKITQVLDPSALRDCKNKIMDVNWDEELALPDHADAKFVKFYNKLLNLLNSCTKEVRKRARREMPKKPWVTKGLLRSINRRDLLFKKKMLQPSDVNERIYKNYRNALNRLLRKAKEAHYKKKFGDAAGNPNKTWRIIKQLINPPHTVAPDQIIGRVGAELSDPSDIAQEFVDHFATVGHNVAEGVRIVDGDRPFQHYLGNSETEFSVYLKPVTESEVKEIIFDMNNSAAGSDILSLRIIKYLWPAISHVLVNLINLCFKQGVFPSCFKLARITPVHKGGDHSEVSNYRPISVLPVMSRLVEKCFSRRLYHYLECHSILTSTQFGFRNGRTTEQAVAYLCGVVNTALDLGFKVSTIFLDIIKAFDTVDHGILLEKCEFYGIRGPALDFLRSFLSNRQQYVRINGSTSSVVDMKCGVPQGSVLGPLLFLIFVNDLVLSLKDAKTKMSDMFHSVSDVTVPLFADDTSLICIAKTERLLVELMTQCLDQVSSWLRVNKIKVNPSKSSFVIFSRTSNYYPWIQEVSYLEGKVKRDQCVRYLGIMLDETLSFRKHVEKVSGILCRNLGILRKLKHVLPPSVLRTLYFSIIHPHILYCSSIWLSTFPSITNRVRVIQNNGIRVLTGKSNLVSVRATYIDVKVLPAAGLRDFYSLQFMFKYNNELLPSCFSGMLKARSSIHDHETRQRENLHAPLVVSARSTFSPIYRGLKLWNGVNKELREIGDLKEFKNKIKGMLYEKYDF